MSLYGCPYGHPDSSVPVVGLPTLQGKASQDKPYDDGEMPMPNRKTVDVESYRHARRDGQGKERRTRCAPPDGTRNLSRYSRLKQVI
ncbi:hypothetical protein CMUS01_03576 [Colletotrichum musicola]|uniref:Uncharacterized protein n=1 Tax=Colletotrichum musicola TaxID=2175873 RepID=A0A8H6NRN8_9PEZI|nr:hypothetical protein CMUS01_03576 [Colletotrichum musicola]